MIYEGTNLSCRRIEGDFAELVLDRQNDKINKFDQQTLRELSEAVTAIKAEPQLRGLLITSAKDVFVVGADITEFLGMFALPEEQILAGLEQTHAIFNSLEDLDMPSVCAINGYALGGGLELALTTDFRVCGPAARVGLPETKLGIIPGFGGTTRLPRLIGADNAIELIAAGKEHKPEAALAIGLIDAVVAQDLVRDAARDLMKQAADGFFDWRARKAEKMGPLKLNMTEGMMVFEGGKAFIKQIAGPHYPAPVKAVEVMQAASAKPRDKALRVEMKAFAQLAKTEIAQNLVAIFLNDQFLKKVSRKHTKIAGDVKSATVLGAGIMGGGIAYQSASRGKVPVIMKDIRPEALALGLSEASKLLGKLLKRGTINTDQMATSLNMITPTLSYADLSATDIVVEAVVENEKVKKSVLAELEDHVREDTIIASNTSTISISRLARALKKPERFVGMHFFNPVHRMPLVEVIRGERSSDEAIATTVAYALKLGKNPIVVKDCPGFLVNRILFPYFAGFSILVGKGADHVAVDKAMERFGWPMGPAYLNDVVGLDTAYHAGQVMAAGFPDRLSISGKTINDVMYEKGRYGQKNGVGFYRYELDKKGKPKKIFDPETHEMIKELAGGMSQFSPEEIVEHMMLPMIFEAARCLEDGIVDTAQEVDMGLIYGVGFPPFRGGALKYADTVGLDKLCETAKKYEAYGKLYQPTERILEMAASGKTFYSY